MAQKDTRRAVAVIYAQSGLPFGILNEALPLLLHQLHVSAGGIGLAALLQLPWTLKFLWAPAVDRRGTPATWFFATATGVALGFAIMALACRLANVPLLLLGAGACAAAAASFDLTSDAMFVRLVSCRRLEASTDSGLRTTAYKAGVMLGSGALIAAAGLFGWQAPLWAMALLTLALRRRFVRFGKQLADPPPEQAGAWRAALRAWLSRSSTPSLLLLVFVYKLALASAAPMGKVALLQSGLPLLSVGASLALLGFAGTSLGAAVAVLLIVRRGLVAALLVGSVSEAAACVCYGLACTFTPAGAGSWPVWAGCSLVEAWAQGLTTTALGALLANEADQRFAAAHFGLMTSLFGLTRACGGPLGGLLATHLGLSGFFFCAPSLALLSLGPLRRFRRLAPQFEQARGAR